VVVVDIRESDRFKLMAYERRHMTVIVMIPMNHVRQRANGADTVKRLERGGAEIFGPLRDQVPGEKHKIQLSVSLLNEISERDELRDWPLMRSEQMYIR
jgi:hypothetical protein